MWKGVDMAKKQNISFCPGREDDDGPKKLYGKKDTVSNFKPKVGKPKKK